MFRPIVIVLSLLNNIICPTSDAYTIEIPNVININEDGSFSIKIKENNLNSNQSIGISFPNSFLLKDEYGKEDIVGHIEENTFTVSKNDVEKIVHYSVNSIPVGKWRGNLTMTIDLNTLKESNVLDNPEYINSILTNISPNTITFSHDRYNFEDVYDISLAKDNSILLYNVDDSEVIITNMTNQKIKANDINGLFSNCNRLLTINNLDYLDTSNCNDFSNLFYNDRYLTTITGIESIATSNVENMSHIFDTCSNIVSINISNWDVSKVKRLDYAFNKDTKITDFSFLYNWNTSSLEDISNMFSSTRASNIDLSKWNVKNVNTVEGLFKQSRFKTIDISNWRLQNCVSMKSCFEGCSYLTSINGLNSLETYKVEDMSYLFASTIFPNLDISNLKTDSLKDISFFLYNNKKITSLVGLEDLNVSNVENMASMFQNCTLLKTLNITNWDTKNVKDMNNFISSVSASSPNNISTIIGIENMNVENVINSSNMFSGCRYLDISDLSKLKPKNVENISNMFSGCWNVAINTSQCWNELWKKFPILTNAFSDSAGKTKNSEAPSWYN